MSRIGRMPVAIPAGVKVTLDGVHIVVEGPKGKLEQDLHPDMTVTVEGEELLVTRPSDDKDHRALHGLTRALIHNMVVGVTTGFKKRFGTGRRWLPRRQTRKNLVFDCWLFPSRRNGTGRRD